jgi:trehalose-phosphatase
LHRGKKVLEAWPAIRWNKGLAILRFLSESKIKPEDCAFFYFGDDTTDEDAFKLLNFQKYSIPIFVGNRRKKTSAKFYLKGPNEVVRYLEFILDVLNCKNRNDKNKNKNISIKNKEKV